MSVEEPVPGAVGLTSVISSNAQFSPLKRQSPGTNQSSVHECYT